MQVWYNEKTKESEGSFGGEMHKGKKNVEVLCTAICNEEYGHYRD